MSCKKNIFLFVILSLSVLFSCRENGAEPDGKDNDMGEVTLQMEFTDGRLSDGVLSVVPTMKLTLSATDITQRFRFRYTVNASGNYQESANLNDGKTVSIPFYDCTTLGEYTVSGYLVPLDGYVFSDEEKSHYSGTFRVRSRQISSPSLFIGTPSGRISTTGTVSLTEGDVDTLVVSWLPEDSYASVSLSLGEGAEGLLQAKTGGTTPSGFGKALLPFSVLSKGEGRASAVITNIDETTSVPFSFSIKGKGAQEEDQYDFSVGYDIPSSLVYGETMTVTVTSFTGKDIAGDYNIGISIDGGSVYSENAVKVYVGKTLSFPCTAAVGNHRLRITLDRTDGRKSRSEERTFSVSGKRVESLSLSLGGEALSEPYSAELSYADGAKTLSVSYTPSDATVSEITVTAEKGGIVSVAKMGTSNSWSITPLSSGEDRLKVTIKGLEETVKYISVKVWYDAYFSLTDDLGEWKVGYSGLPVGSSFGYSARITVRGEAEVVCAVIEVRQVPGASYSTDYYIDESHTETTDPVTVTGNGSVNVSASSGGRAVSVVVCDMEEVYSKLSSKSYQCTRWYDEVSGLNTFEVDKWLQEMYGKRMEEFSEQELESIIGPFPSTVYMEPVPVSGEVSLTVSGCNPSFLRIHTLPEGYDYSGQEVNFTIIVTN